MKKSHRSIFFTAFAGFGILILGSLQSGCGRQRPPILPPAPAPVPTPTCGFTDLGSVLCGATTAEVTVIRDQASWNAFVGASTCSGSTAAPIADFSSQMILVYRQMEGGQDPRSFASFASVCLYSDRLEVAVQAIYQEGIMAPLRIGSCLCQNIAVAVPQTALPIRFTKCLEEYSFNTLLANTCTTTVY